MSTTNSSRLERAGTDRSVDGDDTIAVDDVRYLEAGDRVRLNGRGKPLTVTGTASRTEETLIAERPIPQHAVELEGDWENAVTYVVANRVDLWRGVELEEQRCLESGPTGDVELELVTMADSEWRAE